MRHLHRHRRAVDQHDLVAPVELVHLPRRNAQRHKSGRRCRRSFALPGGRVSPNRVVSAGVSKRPKLLEHPDQRQKLPARARRVHGKQALESTRHEPSFGCGCTVRCRRTPSLRTAGSCAPAGDVQLARDLPDRPAAHQILVAHPRDRIHALSPFHPSKPKGKAVSALGATGVNIPRRSTAYHPLKSIVALRPPLPLRRRRVEAPRRPSA